MSSSVECYDNNNHNEFHEVRLKPFKIGGNKVFVSSLTFHCHLSSLLFIMYHHVYEGLECKLCCPLFWIGLLPIEANTWSNMKYSHSFESVLHDFVGRVAIWFLHVWWKVLFRENIFCSYCSKFRWTILFYASF